MTRLSGRSGAPSRRPIRFCHGLVSLAIVSCQPAYSDRAEVEQPAADSRLLPTGATLDPAGISFDVGSLPLGMIRAPEPDLVVLLLNGWREQGIQVARLSTHQVVQTLTFPAVFLGMAFSSDARWLYLSGGNQDVIYRLRWERGSAAPADSVILSPKAARAAGTRYPAGLALAPDGKMLYVAENLSDSVAVVDLNARAVVQRLPAGRYPYGVAVAPGGVVYVSAWAGNDVWAFAPAAGGLLAPGAPIRVSRHPSALLLNRAGTRLFVASGSTDRVSVVDPAARRVVAELADPPPSGPGEGSTPNALALSDDQSRLFVAEADNNAVAIFDLSAATSGVPSATGSDLLVGRVPTGWYPTAVLASGDTLVVANGKGLGTGPNAADGPQPGRPARDRGYTLGQLSGTVTTVTGARARGADLVPFTARVVDANHWNARRDPPRLPPFEHVVYVVKENRTYDQVLGDLPAGDGDTSLVFFPRAVSPNHHALAERFGVFDRFLVNAEVSPDGHNWSMAAYTTDYVQKTVPSNYSSRGRWYDYEGTNRNRVPATDDDDVAGPARGYLWDLAQRKGITFRNYGEYVLPDGVKPGDSTPPGYRGVKRFLMDHTSRSYPGFDTGIPDQHRADLWIADLNDDAKRGTMPALEIVRLPNDHTAGTRPGSPTPRAFMADNDLALGRMIEALTRSPFWRSAVVFVVEDDAQNGPDHVDSHRAPFLAISPYNRPGVVHRFGNTTDVIATIEEILGLEPLSQFDHFGRPLRDVWAATPDLRPYAALIPAVSLTEKNTARGPGARESERMDFRFEDLADENAFNRALWVAIKGPAVPYPGTRRLSALEWKRGK